MEVHTVPLYLKDLRVITGSLQNIIFKTFGPKGGHALITSSTGQISITHDSSNILSALNLSHPIAKVIIDSVRSFCRTFGDGGKTIIIYTHELLSVIEFSFANLGYSSSNDRTYINTVSKMLHEFIASDILGVCNEVQEFVYVQNCKENKKYYRDLENVIFRVIQTCLTGLPAEIVNHLASIVTALTYVAESGHNFKFLITFLDNFIWTLPNQVYMNSHISDGMFLHGQFAGHQSSATDVRFIFMQCPLEGIVDKQSTDAATLTDTTSDSFLTYRTEVASTFLNCVKSAGVSLVLTTQLVPHYVLQICYKLNINVLADLDIKDFELVTCITGKLPITSIYDSFTEENIGSLSVWECVILSGRHFVKMLFDNHYTNFIPQSLFLCAPTESLCQQLKVLVKTSVTVVEQYLFGLVSSSFKESSVNARPTVHSCSHTVEASSTPGFKQSAADIPPSMNKVLCTKIEHRRSMLQNIVAGCGYFENVMIYFLQCYSRKDISYHKKFCCKVIMTMLEAVPKTLHTNQTSTQSSQSQNFLCKQKEILETINKAMVLEPNAQIKLENCAVDVLNIKLEALFASINLVVKLLRIDAVIGVNRLLIDDNTSEAQVEQGDDIE